MGIIDFQPGETYLHKMDPRVKIILLLVFSVVVFIIKNIIVDIGMVLLFAIFWNRAKLPWDDLIKFGKVVLGVMGVVVLLQTVFYEGDTWMFSRIIPGFKGLVIPENVKVIGGLGMKVEGLEFGILLTFRFMALIILMPMVVKTTNMSMFSLGMVKLGLPYKIAYMATTAMNTVPTFQDEIRVIMDAQKMRGMTVFEEGKTWEKVKAYPALVVPLVIGAMRRAQQMGVAMDTRAFGCKKERTWIDTLQMQRSDWVYLVGGLLIAVGLIVINSFVPPTLFT